LGVLNVGEEWWGLNYVGGNQKPDMKNSGAFSRLSSGSPQCNVIRNTMFDASSLS